MYSACAHAPVRSCYPRKLSETLMTQSSEKSGGEAPKIANTRQLLFAIGLGAVVVVLYNVQVNRIRNENNADMVQKLTYKIDKQPGEMLKADDMTVVQVPRGTEQYLNGVVDESQRTAIENMVMQRPGRQGSFILTDDVVNEEKNRPSKGLSANTEEVSLPLDPTVNLGRSLRIGDTVNLWAMMPDGKNGMKATKIVGGLPVRSIGGNPLGTAQASKRTDDEGMLSYRQIGVQVPRDLVDKLYNLRSWAQNQMFWVTLRSSTNDSDDGRKLNPDIPEKFWTAANTGK